MHWIERYKSKVSSLSEAIGRLNSGSRLFIGSGAAEPSGLVESLVLNGTELRDIEIVHLLTLGPAPYTAADQQHRFRHSAFFIGPNVRQAVQEGRADFMPVFLSEIPRLFSSRRVPLDVALIQVSPPDRHGYVSLGVSVDIVRAAIDSADMILAEVNERMPRTYGQSFLHVSQIEALVPVNRPLPELAREPLDSVSQAIGQHVAQLIPHGATLQTGIGRIPDAVLAALGNHYDLGVHTEMFSDGVMDLVQGGVINGRRKSHLREKIVTSFVMGSQALYDWVHENPAIEMRPSDDSNDPFIIAQNDRMIAINSALAVDLTGQVAADTLMGRFFSGIGGQVDFIRGAARSKGGKPIIALPSTAKKGTLSRIQPTLEAGAGIVTSRGDVHYVVTEYGVADLWGKNVRQRAEALIEVAHPDFRGELLNQARGRKYFPLCEPVVQVGLPLKQARVEVLDDGASVVLDNLALRDEIALKDLLNSEQNSVALPSFEQQEVSLCVRQGSGSDSRLIAAACYQRISSVPKGRVQLFVAEGERRRGIGRLLMNALVQAGKGQSLEGLTFTTDKVEPGLIALLAGLGYRVRTRVADGQFHHSLRFDRRPEHALRGMGRLPL